MRLLLKFGKGKTLEKVAGTWAMLGPKRMLEPGAVAQVGAVETMIEHQNSGETEMRCARVIFERRITCIDALLHEKVEVHI